MATRYKIDPSLSRFTVQAFATGMLSFLGHSPTFEVRDFTGVAEFGSNPPGDMRLEVVARADGLHLVDKVSAADRESLFRKGVEKGDETRAWRGPVPFATPCRNRL
jgi:hypothetical protein